MPANERLQIVSCVGEEFRGMPRAEFEEAMISGSPQPLIDVVTGRE